MIQQVRIQKILRIRFEQLQMKNKSFSCRAFARKIGLSPTTLSLVLKGKRKISRKLAEKTAHLLDLDPQERAEIFSNSGRYSQDADRDFARNQELVQLTTDQFQVIADWRSFAILGMLEIPGFRLDHKWLAKRLDCSENTVKETIERLFRLRMVVENSNGSIQRASPRYRTTDDILNLSLQKSHRQTLELAENSLQNDDIAMRDMTWLTLAIDVKAIPKAKELIREFQENFYNLMQQHNSFNEVYRLAVQFFPLTKTIVENDNEKETK